MFSNQKTQLNSMNSSEMHITDLLSRLKDMANSKEDHLDLYRELTMAYESRVDNESISGSEADKASDWWAENGSFGEFNSDDEIEKLQSIIAGYSQE